VIELAQPKTLGSRAVFRQAVGLLRQTNRAGNPDWYRSALELDHQWHVVVLGTSRFASALHVVSSGQWLAGPRVNIGAAATREQLDAALDEILAQQPFRKGRSLGVIVHLGDEFATTEILAEVKSASALLQLREEILHTPATVLGDPSLTPETTSTRLIPYAGAQRPPLASTVTLSRQHEPAMEMLRSLGEERNLPVIVETLSAPLAAITVMPAFLPLTDGRPHFILLNYNRFSCLSVFNGEGNLLQLRALPHRGRLYPSNLGDAINTAVEALDLPAPAIHILPMGEADPSPLLTQLHATLNNPGDCEMRVMRPALESVAPDLPDLRPEMLVAVPQFSSAGISASFKQLCGERWALQDFFPVPEDIAALYPGRNDMRLLSVGRVLLAVLAFAFVGVVGFAALSLARQVGDPAYSHQPQSTVEMQARKNALARELTEFKHWDNLLQERSKAWLNLEILARLFPEDSGVIVANANYSTRLEATVKNGRVGFTREWVLTGFAKAAAQATLDRLSSRDGLEAAFAELADLTGNQSFQALPGRSLLGSLERGRNNAYKPAPGQRRDAKEAYPLAFTLKITQSFPAEDPMAIGTAAYTQR
jgi:hypothetical protein